MVRREVEKDAMHIATRDVYDASDAGDMSELSAALAEAFAHDPLERVARIKAAAAAELIRKGFPDPGTDIDEVVDGWRKITPGFAHIQATNPRLSSPHLLAQVYLDALSAERALSSGDVAKAFDAGMRLSGSRAIYNARSAHLEKVEKAARFTAPNSGRQSKTVARQAFLEELADHFQTTNREALAAHAVGEHPNKVRELWSAEGEQARDKILNFLRNHPLA